MHIPRRCGRAVVPRGNKSYHFNHTTSRCRLQKGGVGERLKQAVWANTQTCSGCLPACVSACVCLCADVCACMCTNACPCVPLHPSPLRPYTPAGCHICSTGPFPLKECTREEVSEQTTIKLDTNSAQKVCNGEVRSTRSFVGCTSDALEMKCCAANTSDGECCVWQQHTSTTYNGSRKLNGVNKWWRVQCAKTYQHEWLCWHWWCTWTCLVDNAVHD
jgi:hypothetical protein